MRPAAVALLGLVVLAVGAAAVADALMEPPLDPPVEAVAAEEAPAGTWYCPATGDEDETAALTVAAVGETPADVTVVSYAAGGPAPGDPVEVAPGQPRDFDVDPRHPVAVRWDGGPAAASWRVEADGQAAGAPCAAAASPTWHVAGFDTALGATSTLHLFNPFAVDAVVRVTFATPDGSVAPQRTENVVVNAGRATRLELNELQPEEDALAATVEVLSGRVAAAGEVVFDPPERPDGEPGEGPRGRVIIPAAPEEALEWGFGLARRDDNADGWLVLANPEDRTAEVELRASEPVADSEVLGEVSIPAGGVRRIDLADASEQIEAGVSVTSLNGVGTVAVKVTAFEYEDRVGVIAGTGAQPAPESSVVGAGTDGRAARLGVYNPAGTAVRVDVEAGEGTPAAWRGVELGPNERLVVDLSEAGDGRAAMPVRVRASGSVVAEIRSTSTADEMAAWGAPGVPPEVWAGPPTRPTVRRDPSLPVAPPVSSEVEPE